MNSAHCKFRQLMLQGGQELPAPPLALGCRATIDVQMSGILLIAIFKKSQVSGPGGLTLQCITVSDHVAHDLVTIDGNKSDVRQVGIQVLLLKLLALLRSRKLTARTGFPKNLFDLFFIR